MERVPLLESGENEERRSLGWRVFDESKKLWRIAGPAIFQRVVIYSTIVITQAFAGHLGDLELAAFSISNVITGFNFGLFLGMASALETLCGQAFGAKNYHMLSVYLQRSWIVLFIFAVMLLPIYFYTTPLLKLCGEPDDLAEMAGTITIWQIPQHFAYAFMFPINRFLQSQLKNWVTAASAAMALVSHIILSWMLLYKWHYGLVTAVLILDSSWWLVMLGQFFYIVCGGCTDTWKGLSMEAFANMWEFVKLSTSSGVMLCLESWYYRVLVLLTGYLPNSELAVDALSICVSINTWELMISLAFFAGTGVRVANELGAGRGHAAKFAMIVSVVTSLLIGIFFWALILAFHDKIALLFTSSEVVLNAVEKLSVLLACTILLNSVQPVLSGVAVGSGWQSVVAYVNIGSYYLIGVPFEIFLGWTFHYGVLGIWAGMIGGTFVQTIILAILTMRCNWTEEANKASRRISRWSK
ncbi:protein TRANSPARENT TESTA 12-like protein [Carex littledalei]|uniref:Protein DETOXIFICATION n=1 Tax=Carex littledalei TaxID=544730 RepID=A0A833RP96_9POAL|nr:protein TRANSPARENT TESTA 12-like protein [Carex littledalei]